MQWHPESHSDVRRTNPLLTAFQYKKPLRHTRKLSGKESLGITPAASGLVNQIHDLSDRLRTELAPQFDQLENELDKYVVQVRQKVDQMDDLHTQVRSAVDSFTTQVSQSEEKMEGSLEKLRHWMARPRDIGELKRRLEAAQAQLQVDSQRLEALNSEIATQVMERHKSERNEVVRYRMLLSSILVALIAISGYYLYISTT